MANDDFIRFYKEPFMYVMDILGILGKQYKQFQKT